MQCSVPFNHDLKIMSTHLVVACYKLGYHVQNSIVHEFSWALDFQKSAIQLQLSLLHSLLVLHHLPHQMRNCPILCLFCIFMSICVPLLCTLRTYLQVLHHHHFRVSWLPSCFLKVTVTQSKNNRVMSFKELAFTFSGMGIRLQCCSSSSPASSSGSESCYLTCEKSII